MSLNPKPPFFITGLLWAYAVGYPDKAFARDGCIDPAVNAFEWLNSQDTVCPPPTLKPNPSTSTIWRPPRIRNGGRQMKKNDWGSWNSIKKNKNYK